MIDNLTSFWHFFLMSVNCIFLLLKNSNCILRLLKNSNIRGQVCPLHEITLETYWRGKMTWFEITSGLYFNLWSQAVAAWLCVAWGHFSKPHSSCPWGSRISNTMFWTICHLEKRWKSFNLGKISTHLSRRYGSHCHAVPCQALSELKRSSSL